MKALKIFMVVLIAVAFIMPLTVSESQAAAWYTCYVNRAGQSPSTVNVMLSEVSSPAVFYQTYFTLDPTNKTALLSTALTAMASGMKVFAYVPGTTGGTCTGMFLLDQ
ncbi:MAG: hypothetical protein NTY36_03220 [Deltaproteobacteria bacterium]|nr:hypothetical protein [Deltaproteobacteria bacterium]